MSATPDQTGEPMIKADRDALIRIAKARAKQAEREAETQEKILIVEVLDLMAAEFEARDQMWAAAVAIAEEAAAKANTQIQARCAELGIPPRYAPQLELGWRSRSGEFANRERRGELRKLAEARAAAVTKTAKTATPPSGLRPAAVALRATQNSGLAFSSDRRAPDPSRQSADGCALWSRLETRYLRLPSPLRHNIFRQTLAPFGPHSDEDLRWRPGAPQACHFASVIGNHLSIGNPQRLSRPAPWTSRNGWFWAAWNRSRPARSSRRCPPSRT